ncbi:MAG: alpha/beta hydrolase [Desulfovibrionaceae bacterium]|nr:alpha/beta hydrolase [Desulfovibrionaceae bacterium]
MNTTSRQDMLTGLPGYTPGANVIDVPVTEEGIDFISNAVYAQVLGPGAPRSLHLNLLVPRSPERRKAEQPSGSRPAVLCLPGGGFLAADRDRYIGLRMALARRGFVVACAEYRVIPDLFPGLVLDAKRAVRFLRRHAGIYGIDPDRIAVLGHSAGGYLAQMLGLTNDDPAFEPGADDGADGIGADCSGPAESCAVQAVVSVYGVSNLASIGEGFPDPAPAVNASPASPAALLLHGAAMKDRTGGSILDNEEMALAASPMGHVGRAKPPFLLLHGSGDTLVSPMQSARLYEALRHFGCPADYMLVRDANHGDNVWYQDNIAEGIGDWLVRTLGDPHEGPSSEMAEPFASCTVPQEDLPEALLPGQVPGARLLAVQGDTARIDMMDNVVYERIVRRSGARSMHMSLLVPRAKHATTGAGGRRPALVFFPGGGFLSANRSVCLQLRMALAEKGFVVASAEYRVVPDIFPAPLKDARAAVRFLRSHALNFGIDPDRIGALGESGGGWLASLLGMTGDAGPMDGEPDTPSCGVQAVATLYGLSDLARIGEGYGEEIERIHLSPAAPEALYVHGAALAPRRGASIASAPEAALAASPTGHAGPGRPPFLILHGTADTLVSPMQAERLYQVLKKDGNEAEYVLVRNAGHADSTWHQQAICRLVADWFENTLAARSFR